jgi:hypothetical protein
LYVPPEICTVGNESNATVTGVAGLPGSAGAESALAGDAKPTDTTAPTTDKAKTRQDIRFTASSDLSDVPRPKVQVRTPSYAPDERTAIRTETDYLSITFIRLPH